MRRREREVIIKTLFYFSNGSVASFDENDQQVPAEQVNAFYRDIADKIDRGVVNDKTEVLIAGEPVERLGHGPTIGSLRAKIDAFGRNP